MDKGFISVKDISFLCGFNDPLYFSKVFKAKTELSPSQYVKNLSK
jgi:two-component system response regulator YesN